MPAWELLDHLRAEGFTVTQDGGTLWVEPASRRTDDLRAAIRQQKADLLECLRLEEPAPEWTEAEQAEYDSVLGEMARVLDDGDLVRHVETFGARLTVDENGRLRAENAGLTPPAV